MYILTSVLVLTTVALVAKTVTTYCFACKGDPLDGFDSGYESDYDSFVATDSLSTTPKV